jgi:NAD(P)-dependent dehydrogenase (short-subunit alcohol dehydrogenase family)
LTRFAGRVALVTGAGSGIGAAIALQLAAEGASVGCVDIDEASAELIAGEIQSRGFRGVSAHADVSELRAVIAAHAAIEDAFGSVDIVVNNAGIAVFGDPLRLSADDWKRCFAVDLDGVWHGCRAALPSMVERGRGSIVNIASVHAFKIIPGCFPYPAAKHAVVGLTRALAVEYGPVGIRVNAVCPSYISTQVSRDYWATFPDPDLERKRTEDLHPLRRVGTPEDVASAVLFLASDEASFITGESLLVDGGRSAVFHD